jgi:hypothetical protein
MRVNATHADYDTNLGAWSRARDVFAGEGAVKSAGVRYLPKLDSQSDDEYKAYRARAAFFNATARTADGFVGLIFRREATMKLPEPGSGVGKALAAFADDADMLGTTLNAYAIVRFHYLNALTSTRRKTSHKRRNRSQRRVEYGCCILK